jgi:hypothetical protein
VKEEERRKRNGERNMQKERKIENIRGKEKLGNKDEKEEK